MKKSVFYQTKKLLVIVCCFTSIASLKSQTFTIIPANAQTLTFNCDSSMQGNTIHISNTTSSTLDLSYTILSNTLPQKGCWDYQFCDWEKCRIGLPYGINHPFDKIPANSKVSPMALDIYTMHMKGAGSLAINVFETGNPSNSQTITWNVIGCAEGNECTTAIAEFISEKNISLYPSPALDNITIGTDNIIKIHSIHVYTVLGKNIINQEVNNLNTYELNISKLENGIYIMEINTENGRLTKKFVKD
jgi:hypothetical protein